MINMHLLNNIIIFCFLLLLGNLYSQETKQEVIEKQLISTETAKINIAVADFVSKNVSQADASIISDFIRTELVNTGVFRVIDRNNMETILAEQKFQASGCTEQQCAIQMGKILNVQQMVIGTLSQLLDVYYITVSLVDVETGNIISSYDKQAKSSEELKTATRYLAEEIAGVKVKKIVETEESRIPKIINIEDKKITINKGRVDMIESRQIYDIYDKNDIKIGKMKITETSLRKSYAKLMNGTPQIGDILAYSGRKSKTGSIGLTFGYKRHNMKPSGISDTELTEPFSSYGIYYEYINSSGLGVQLNICWNDINLHHSLYSYDASFNYFWHWTSYAKYNFPVILKYHLCYDSDISLYTGIGLYYHINHYSYKYNKHDNQTWNIVSEEHIRKNAQGISSLFNAGIELFAMRTVHLSFDMKYYVGKKNKFLGNTDITVLSTSVSFNW